MPRVRESKKEESGGGEGSGWRYLSYSRDLTLPSSATEGGQGEGNDDEGDNDDVEWDPEPLLTYGEVLEWYRLGRRTAPAPHPELTRQQAVLLRQLQTQSVITPALARHVCPDVYASDMCSVCGQHRATLAHILWDCAVHPVEAADLYGRLPDTITSAVYSTDLDAQTLAVQQLEAALARQKRSESQTGGKGRIPEYLSRTAHADTGGT